MNINWNILIAAIGGAAIDFLEIAVIAYAIARSGYRREAIAGSIFGVLLVGIIAIPFGGVLRSIPLNWLEIIVGITLLWFGWRWVNKSIKRLAKGKRAGWMSDDPLAAEEIVLDGQNLGFNQLNFWVMAKSAILETFEVAILIVTLGLASGAWYESLAGTAIALVFAVVIVTVLHNYLLNVPEVLIKLGSGILLGSLGTFWLGEGLGFDWLFGDLAIAAIVAAYSGIAAIVLWWLKRDLLAVEIVDRADIP
jgi:Ca2+/H+ antiporter, TMEM165/GDT1 family